MVGAVGKGRCGGVGGAQAGGGGAGKGSARSQRVVAVAKGRRGCWISVAAAVLTRAHFAAVETERDGEINEHQRNSDEPPRSPRRERRLTRRSIECGETEVWAQRRTEHHGKHEA